MPTLTYDRQYMIKKLKESRAEAEKKVKAEHDRLGKLVEKQLRANIKAAEDELATFLKGGLTRGVYVDGTYWYPPGDKRYGFNGAKWDNAIKMLDMASDSEIKITSARGETIFDLL